MALPPAQLTQLAAEIANDPNAYGLVAMRDAGNDDGIAAVLNLPRATITVQRDDISSQEIVQAITVADFVTVGATPTAAALSSERRYLAWMTMLASVPRVRLFNDNGSNGPVVENLIAMFPAGTGTFTRLAALASRQGSRAEQLFGRNARVTNLDVSAAVRPNG